MTSTRTLSPATPRPIIRDHIPAVPARERQQLIQSALAVVLAHTPTDPARPREQPPDHKAG